MQIMQQKFIRFAGLIVFCLVSIFFIWSWINEELTGHFSLENISFTNVPTGEFLPQTIDVSPILSQTFAYLGKGRQTYVFVSEDQKYVLKFFRTKRLKPALWSTEREEKRRLNRIEKLFTGHRVAFLESRENAGLIYVHLEPTNNLKTKINVLDFWGQHREIDADSTIFVIQKRATITKDILVELFQKKDIVTAKKRLDNLVGMISADYQLGLIDGDHNVIYNTGFIGEKPIRIDVGQLRHDDSVRDPREAKRDLAIIIEKKDRRVA